MLLFSNAYTQLVNVPLLDNVIVVKEVKELVPVELYYNEAKNLVYKVGETTITDINYLAPQLEIFLEQMPDYYRVHSKIEIIADRDIKLADFDAFQEELKRLNCRFVVFVAQTQNISRSFGNWTTGVQRILPPRDSQNIYQFYKKHEMPFQAMEDLKEKISYKKVEERKDTINFEDMFGKEILPPPPVATTPVLFKWDSLAKIAYEYYDLHTIEIKSGDTYLVNGKRYSKQDYGNLIADKIELGLCVFLIKPYSEASYGSYVYAIGKIHELLAIKKNKIAQEKFNIDYSTLKSKDKYAVSESMAVISFIEPIFMQE